MFFEPSCKPETKADPFSLESLIAWLEKQPAAKGYDFCKWDNCLLAQWLHGIDPTSRVGVGPTGYFYSVLGKTVDLTHFTHIARAYRGIGDTFGAALARARAVAASRS